MKQKRILIVRPDRIGDVVLSTPIPREIKKQYPDSFVAVLVRKYTKDIYVHNPNVDEILLFEENPSNPKNYFWEKVKEIRSFHFSHALMLLPNERINYILFLAGIKKRIGVGYKFFQFITGVKGISRNKYIPLRHEADYSLDLVRAIGIQTENMDVEIHLNRKERETVMKIKSELLNGKKYLIGVHSSSGNSAPNWNSAIYRKLINNLLLLDSIRIVNTDFTVPETIRKNLDIKFVCEGNNLRETILNIAALDLLISASTGPMHIAAALKIKTVSLFCPLTACSPKLWGPVGNEQSIILPTEKFCSNYCPGDPKLCNYEGEKGISVDKVISELKLLLKLN